jgi:hypothetical protein
MNKEVITFRTSFIGGAGTVNFSSIDGLGDQTISSDDSTTDFTSEQSVGQHTVLVTGFAADGGHVIVDINDRLGNNIGKHTFSGSFNNSIQYQVNNTGPR